MLAKGQQRGSPQVQPWTVRAIPRDKISIFSQGEVHMKRWKQSALLIFGLVCFFNAWGQNESSTNEKESTCEKIKLSQWAKRYDDRIGAILLIQKNDYVNLFENQEFLNSYDQAIAPFLDGPDRALSRKIHAGFTGIATKNSSTPIEQRFILAKIYAKYIKELNDCALSSELMIFSGNLRDYLKSKGTDRKKKLTAENRDLVTAANFILGTTLKDIGKNGRIIDEVDKILNGDVPNNQLASFIAFSSKNADALIAQIQNPIEDNFQNQISNFQKSGDAQHSGGLASFNQRNKERHAEEQKIKERQQYAASPDGQLDAAFDKFMTVEQCYKDRLGFTVGFITNLEYQDSKNKIKFIQDHLRPVLKESADTKWKRVAQSFKFSAKPNLFLNDQALELACRGALSSLDAIFKEGNPSKGPIKSF